MIKNRFSAVLLFAAISFPQIVVGQTASDTIKDFVTDNVVAVACVDLSKADVDRAIEIAVEVGLREENELADLIKMAPLVKSTIASLQQLGVGKIFSVMRTRDIQHGVCLVIPIAEGKSPLRAAATIEPLAALLNLDMSVEAADGVVLVGSRRQLDYVKSTIVAGMPQKVVDLGALDSFAGVAVFGDQDSRRVVQELFPRVPISAEGFDGNFIAQKIDSIAARLDIDQPLDFRLVVTAKDEAAATAVESVLAEGSKLLASLPALAKYIPEGQTETLLDALKPIRDSNRVIISTEKLMGTKLFSNVIAPHVRTVRSTVDSQNQLYQLRQLALAMHNFESATRAFPAVAKFSDDGKPLLSWRVEVLPFLGGEAAKLYQQFKLDEPWDSEHNLKLVKKMPRVFYDNRSIGRKNNLAGKTVFQVASGKGLIFDGPKKATFGEIEDGSSNTLLIATVATKHAAVWTQPDEWEVDLSDPVAQLVEQNRTHFEVAVGDGSTARIPLSIDKKDLANFIRPSDGQVVELPN